MWMLIVLIFWVVVCAKLANYSGRYNQVENHTSVSVNVGVPGCEPEVACHDKRQARQTSIRHNRRSPERSGSWSSQITEGGNCKAGIISKMKWRKTK